MEYLIIPRVNLSMQWKSNKTHDHPASALIVELRNSWKARRYIRAVQGPGAANHESRSQIYRPYHIVFWLWCKQISSCPSPPEVSFVCTPRFFACGLMGKAKVALFWNFFYISADHSEPEEPRHKREMFGDYAGGDFS